MNEVEFIHRLKAVTEKHLGTVKMENARRLTGGASSETWLFDVVSAAGRIPLILRRSEVVEQISTGINKEAEAQVQQAAFEAGVPVARVIFSLAPEDRLGDGYVMSYIQGESIPRKILRDQSFDKVRPELTNQCGEILARIHSVDAPASLPALTVDEQLKRLAADYRSYGQTLPVFELALRWLELNRPETERISVVHGDFRNGNFLVTPEEGIVGVLDWELCHRGDPMEDLGWLCVNSWRFGNRHLAVGGFGSREELFSAYERVTGVKVEAARVHYWEVLGVLKWGVICLYMCFADLQDGSGSVERAAIGRRVSETEIDLLTLLTEGAPQ